MEGTSVLNGHGQGLTLPGLGGTSCICLVSTNKNGWVAQVPKTWSNKRVDVLGQVSRNETEVISVVDLG